MFTQPFNEAQIKENINAPRHWPSCWNSPETGEYPVQGASNAENGSIWWRHHDMEAQHQTGMSLPEIKTSPGQMKWHATYAYASMLILYNMTVWIFAGNYISFTIAAGFIRLHMPGVKKSRV